MTTPFRPALTPVEYSKLYPQVPGHMLRTESTGRVEVVLLPFVNVPGKETCHLSCRYPGGYVSAGLWDVRAWMVAFDEPGEAEKITDDGAFAIRIFDYDDGDCVLYGPRQTITELWGLLTQCGEVTGADLFAFGFRTE